MPRPTTKTDLIEAANHQYDKLMQLVDYMSPEEQTTTFLFEDRDKTLRDVLYHLHQWHNMMKDWHQVGIIEGGLPDVPGKGYTWRTLPDLNHVIWESCQDVSLEETKPLLAQSHQTILSLIDSHTNDELFTKQIYKWTKSSTLGSYFVSNTASHYDWAMKKLRKHIKTYRAAQ